mmetsp:Transcript_1598/g.4752  ORF Transcript_1598/g.4752 Transcript_1598/m.4752 type:complete len:216 (+) Transcript_1598:225-872(+)
MADRHRRPLPLLSLLRRVRAVRIDPRRLHPDGIPPRRVLRPLAQDARHDGEGAAAAATSLCLDPGCRLGRGVHLQDLVRPLLDDPQVLRQVSLGHAALAEQRRVSRRRAAQLRIDRLDARPQGIHRPPRRLVLPRVARRRLLRRGEPPLELTQHLHPRKGQARGVGGGGTRGQRTLMRWLSASSPCPFSRSMSALVLATSLSRLPHAAPRASTVL